ncbi:PRC-barrel domain-containing protein [Archaeoglobus profundus]|uniref:PRC-barrel domain protein n=1 Tax=Archaeoglobus profundus (strain DSM 5631 / JCM 9629 / NBRC 100127 / Av18) TaxID=572546 RepID=D2REE8_ARCPA|nr:PRC-barrel domain-containing protein [Archaeoglobus profundus]ADB58492.1 PRC-barrel domain protein [Archaeoglobus profundus DSM 5631]
MITAKSLAKKTVTLSDGTIVGELYNILVDFKTGTLLSLLVKPSRKVDDFEMQDGLYVIPFEYVKAVSDYVVINRRR